MCRGGGQGGKLKIISWENGILKKGKKKKFPPALAVTPSLCSGGQGVGTSVAQLRLWAEISTNPWMVNNHVIEEIKLLAGKIVCRKEKIGPILTCACSHTFSLQLRRGVGSGSQLCLWA